MSDEMALITAMKALKASKNIGRGNLDNQLDSVIGMLSGLVEPKTEVFSTGTYTGDRAISSTFAGWASAVTYQGEKFSGLKVYLVLESTNVKIKCSIMDRNRKPLTSTIQTIEKTGWAHFNLPVVVDSKLINDTVFYVAVEVVGHTSRLALCNMTASSRYGGSLECKDYYTTTASSDGSWFVAIGQSGTGYGSYSMLVSFFGSDIETHYTVSSVGGTKTPKITATNSPTGTARTDPFNGMGMICNNDSSVSDFNMLKILYSTRQSDIEESKKWRKVKVQVRDVNQNGPLIASGEISVDPSVSILRDVEVLLDKTVTKAMLSSTYFLGYTTTDEFGGYAWSGEGKATIPNFAGSSFYRDKTTWAAYLGNPSFGIESWLVTNPTIINSKVPANLRLNIPTGTGTGTSAPSIQSVSIVLPPQIDALVGKEVNIYFDNLLKYDANDYYFNVTCSIGAQQNERWTCVPTVAGTSAITIDIYDKQFNKLGTASSSVVVKNATVGIGVSKKVLFIGDSTTNAAVYTGELLTLFGASDPMDITLLGSRGTGSNLHEGRGGWTVNMYNTVAESGGITNPFYNTATSKFDFSYYMTQRGYASVDYVGIHLGINDVFNFSDDATLLASISTILITLDSMVANIKSFNSSIKVGIMVTIPASKYQDSFAKSYQNGQTTWRYKQNWFLWINELMSMFKSRTGENIFIVPLYTNLDTVNNMATETIPVNSRSAKTVARQSNGVHPANEGYYQMADTIYYWLKGFES